jgi:PAS domain S-box-containing protein
MSSKPTIILDPTELRRRAETRLRGQRKGQRSKSGDQKSEADTVRLLHELEVHQIELEMQNAELQKARNELEVTLEKYTSLYDFAPVGYFSLDESGVILEVNLTGAAMLGVDRSRLINRRMLRFVVPESQPLFVAFLERVCGGTGKQACEVALLKEDATVFWVSVHGTAAISASGSQKSCRVAVSDITSLKQAEEAQLRIEAQAIANQKLQREIDRREVVEESLRKSEQHYGKLLQQSRDMQEQLRHLSHQILSAQEEERKKISRELHDEIAQTLTGINVQLAALKVESRVNVKDLQKKIARTQRLVEKSVDIVHRFARELRPTVLDDLGLIPALHSFVKGFSKQTRIHIRLTVFAGVEKLDNAKRTVLYRVAQEALTNVARHAQASLVEVSIEKLSDNICMKIKDDGKSFQVGRTLHTRKAKRLGLVGMRERVEMVGGSFNVESTSGKGTTIRAQIPFTNGEGTQGL